MGRRLYIGRTAPAKLGCAAKWQQSMGVLPLRQRVGVDGGGVFSGSANDSSPTVLRVYPGVLDVNGCAISRMLALLEITSTTRKPSRANFAQPESAATGHIVCSVRKARGGCAPEPDFPQFTV